MKCKFCREELPQGAKFCPVCGTPVEPDQEENESRNEDGMRQGENHQYGSPEQGQNPYQYGSSEPGQNPYQYGSSEPGQNPYQYGDSEPGRNPYQYGRSDQYQYGPSNPNQWENPYQYNSPNQGGYQYGSPNQGQHQNSGAPNSGTPYMILAIFTVLMCCMPLGIVAIVYASRINGFLRSGDYEGAREAAKKVKIFSIIGIIGGLVSMTLFFAFNLTEITNEIITPSPILSEVGKADEDDIPDIDGYDDDEDEDKKPAVSGPAAQSSELGETWSSYTVQINDKVLTLPCTYEELEAAGLTLDTDDIPEDYVVNANEYKMVFFEDANDNYVMADLVNGTDNAKTIKECLVGGISVTDYGVSEGGITVFFPGGLKIGSTREEMLEKYGNTDDVYEGDNLCIYTWYAEDTYYSSCEIDLDTETGLINSMNIQNHGE